MSFGWLSGANDLADDQEELHESGAGRMGSAMCQVCCAPVVLIIAMILTGWNEKRAVCQAVAISEGQRVAESVGCDSASAKDGNLIYFSCKYSHDGLKKLTPRGDFQNKIEYPGTGLSVRSEMYLCKETSTSKTKKDNVGGGKTTIKTYSYEATWSSTPIDTNFYDKNKASQQCGVDRNPTWDQGLPQSYTDYAPSVNVGAFSVGAGYVSSISLDIVLKTPNPPPNYVFLSDWYWTSSNTAAPRIGDGKITFRSSSGNKMVSVLGKNNGGKITTWKASSSWGCSGDSIGSLMMGEVSKDEFFKGLKAGNTFITWVLRLIGFAVFWCGFHMFFAPLEVFADCIPCIGPYLGDAINCITCVLSCLPATACFVFIAGIVWIAMRPLVGIPLLLICCIITALGVAYKMKTGHLGGGKVMNKVQGNLDPNMVGIVEEHPQPASEEALPEGMGAFFATRAPSGRPWHAMVSGVTPEFDGEELGGVWKDCMIAAVRYESNNPGWADDPKFADGPAGHVCAWLEAHFPNAVSAANRTEEANR